MSEVILFGPPNSISSSGANLGDLLNNIKQAARNLGAIFDANICFDDKVKNVVRSCFFQFKILSKIK